MTKPKDRTCYLCLKPSYGHICIDCYNMDKWAKNSRINNRRKHDRRRYYSKRIMEEI